MRYIDADAFIEEYDGAENSGYTLKELVEDCPTADVVPRARYKRLLENSTIMADALKEYENEDVVEVVRCKDCKHFHEGIYNGEYWMLCDEYKNIALSSDEWFCADGKRREDDSK